MQSVVFLRGVNVGHRTLRTAEFASSLGWGTVNIGAAGTFVVPEGPAPETLRGEIARKLPFETEVFVIPGPEVSELVASEPFGPRPPSEGVRRAVTVVPPGSKVPAPLPFARPTDRSWGVRVLRVIGPFVLSEYRRLDPTRILYPNEVIEETFRQPATTRWWETLQTIDARLRGAPRAIGDRRASGRRR